MPCRLLCKSTKRLPGFSSGSLLSGILPRDMQYSTTTAPQVPHSSNSGSALHAFNKLNLICVLKIPLLLLQSLLWKVGENTYRKEKNLQKRNLKHEIHLPYIHLLHCPVLSQSYGTTNHSAGGDTNAGATSYHYHCFDYCYDYDSERTSDQDRQQQQQQHISVGMLPHPVALASEGCHNMPCAICYSICWSIYKIKDFTQAPLETFKSQISCPCLHIRCSICTFLGSLAPSPTNSVPQVSSLNFMEILV